jgi:hypothetical protein
MVNLNLIFDFLVNFYSEMFTRNVIPLSKKEGDDLISHLLLCIIYSYFQSSDLKGLTGIP